MGSENDVQRIEEEVRRLESLLEQQVDLSRKASRYSLFVTASLAGIILLFFVVNYFNITEEFTQENISRSLEKEMHEFSPTAMRELNLLGKDVLPVYVKEGRNQIRAMGPQIAERMQHEVDQLTQDILADVQRHVQKMEANVLESTETVLFESYPGIQDKATQEVLTQRFRTIAEGAVAGTIGDFQERFGLHVDGVQETLLKFDLSDTEETPLDLQKKFLHLWLQLLDEEIMAL